MSIALRIHDQFLDSIQTATESMTMLEEPVEQATHLLTDCLMRAGKILVCGVGASGLAARHFATILADRFEQDRPGLAAVALERGSATMMDDADPCVGLARQVAALAQPGDVVCVFSIFGHSLACAQAIRAAHERDLPVVVLTGGDGGSLAEMLNEHDTLICVPSHSAPRVIETQFLLIHSLCDSIDFFLLGT